ncbi:hypothetical protein [Streptomyces sp. 4N124]|uniref:hypothetical protein n=1 Tax=Streptomyces sp. 4N124 TaxID=3457420 RepID=UPI003FD0C257
MTNYIPTISACWAAYETTRIVKGVTLLIYRPVHAWAVEGDRFTPLVLDNDSLVQADNLEGYSHLVDDERDLSPYPKK